MSTATLPLRVFQALGSPHPQATKRVQGEDHPDVATSLNHLATCLQVGGNGAGGWGKRGRGRLRQRGQGVEGREGGVRRELL